MQTSLDSHSNNFTALRLFAALLVLYGHAFELYKLPAPSFMGWMPLGPIAVYIFFAISGYLISISWTRDSHIVRFVLKRVLRIFPGLIVCILLTIFVLGALTTTLSFGDYFKNPQTWLQRAGVILLAVLFFIANYYIGLTTVVFYAFPVQYLAICGMYFLVGVGIHQWRLLRFLSASNVIAIAVIWLSLSRWPTLFEYVSYILLPFLTIAFGTGASKAFTWLDKYDYSYGVYIPAFPVQQVISFYFLNHGFRFGIFTSAIITLCLAALSWHWIEKPALQYKKLFKTSAI